jgi:methionine biosynthesis protein MetW
MFDYAEYREGMRGMEEYLEKPLNRRLQIIVEAIPSNSAVLDVACGTGRVLQAAIEKGCRGRGIELSPAGVAASRKKGLDVIEGDIDSFGENAEVHDLIFGRYDIAIFSKCLMYLKTKNEIIDRLNADTMIVFQKNPSHWKARWNGRGAKQLVHDTELPYRLKTGEVIVADSPGAFARWGESYGFKYSRCLHGGFRHHSMIVKMSRNPL